MEKKKKDGSSSSTNQYNCDHRMAIEKIERGQELVSRLKQVIGSAGTPEPVNELFNGIQNSLSNALFGLRYSCLSSSGKVEEKELKQEDYPTDKIRRRHVEATIVTPTPHYDGHQWRKYGEKQINGTKYERAYFRCTYSKDLKCLATKTVQQVEGTADPPVYSVIYYNHHICNLGGNNNNSSNTPPTFSISPTSFPKRETSPISNTSNQEIKNIHLYDPQLHDGSSSSSMDMGMMDGFFFDSYLMEDLGPIINHKKD
ncbi:hypothetical protein LUZ60_011037 [Juncus effusus]|nr:hypothetical protein LUZ60_011037 [Juncus effusus]